MSQYEYNKLTGEIIRSAIEVHRQMGPGLMESVYDFCLFEELRSRGFYVERQKLLPVRYKDLFIEKAFVIDQLVEDKVIIELKSIEGILPIHESQLVTYLKLAEKKLGLLINFNVPVLKQGIRRKINGNL